MSGTRDAHPCGHTCDAVRGVRAAGSIGLVQVILQMNQPLSVHTASYIYDSLTRAKACKEHKTSQDPYRFPIDSLLLF